MNKKLLTLAAAVAFVGTAVLNGQSASADVGDGLLSCNSGEICYSRDPANTTYQKHFWWASDHAGYQFTNVSTGATNQGALQNGADQIRNRDTSCEVKTVDDRGIFPDDVYNVYHDGTWHDIPGSVDDENDRHERHACS
jgi:hypothetical protein